MQRQPPTFHELLTDIRSKRPGAWDRLVRAYEAELLVTARTALKDALRAKLDPEDLVQDTLIQAYEGFDQFRGADPAELSSWLRRILASQLARVVRRYLGSRSRDIRRELSVADGSGPGLPGSGTSPSHGAMRREMADRMEMALRNLPEEYRLVIVSRERLGLSIHEIARLLGRSENAVRKLWPRALLALQQLL